MTLSESAHYIDRVAGIIMWSLVGIALLAISTYAIITFPPNNGAQYLATACLIGAGMAQVRELTE